MFERFTDRARQSMVLAQEETRELKHNYIGTEHLLLGLLREDEGVAALALKSLNLTLDQVRKEVESIVGRGAQYPSGHISYTPQATKILEYSLREALHLGHNYIGTEHILLAIIREGAGVAAQVLERTVTGGMSAVRVKVLDLLTTYREYGQNEDNKEDIVNMDQSQSEFQLDVNRLVMQHFGTSTYQWTLSIKQDNLPDITVTIDKVMVSGSEPISPEALTQINQQLTRILQSKSAPEKGTSPL